MQNDTGSTDFSTAGNSGFVMWLGIFLVLLWKDSLTKTKIVGRIDMMSRGKKIWTPLRTLKGSAFQGFGLNKQNQNGKKLNQLENMLIIHSVKLEPEVVLQYT